MTDTPEPPVTVEQVERVLEFLNGKDHLDGAFFGDPHPDHFGMFWWREEVARVLSGVVARLQAQPAGEREGWMPIETAPKNVGILGFWMLDEKRGHIDRIWWDAEFEQSGWNERDHEPEYRGAWSAGRVNSWAYEEYAEEHPTHWRPLPPPPSKTEDSL